MTEPDDTNSDSLWDPTRWGHGPLTRAQRRERERLRAEWTKDFSFVAMPRKQRRISLVIATVAVAFFLLPVLGRASGWYAVVPVLSGSMEPDMKRGDIALVIPVSPDRVAEGDVIVFDNPERTGSSVIHRVVAVNTAGGEGVTVRTKGDNNETVDPWTLAVSHRGEISRRVLTVPFVGHAYLLLQSAALRGALVLVGLLAAASFVAGVLQDRADGDNGRARHGPSRQPAAGSTGATQR